MMSSMSSVFENTLPDHTAVSNARCGHPQGGGVSHTRTKVDEWVGKQDLLADVLY